MRILFLSTNRFRIEVAQPMPIGLACVIASIDENAHTIGVLDLMFCETDKRFKRAIKVR